MMFVQVNSSECYDLKRVSSVRVRSIKEDENYRFEFLIDGKVVLSIPQSSFPEGTELRDVTKAFAFFMMQDGASEHHLYYTLDQFIECLKYELLR